MLCPYALSYCISQHYLIVHRTGVCRIQHLVTLFNRPYIYSVCNLSPSLYFKMCTISTLFVFSCLFVLAAATRYNSTVWDELETLETTALPYTGFAQAFAYGLVARVIAVGYPGTNNTSENGLVGGKLRTSSFTYTAFAYTSLSIALIADIVDLRKRQRIRSLQWTPSLLPY